MNMTFPIISAVIGLLCGIISGFGIGGGSLLMVWMTAVMQTEQSTAQSINLMYFLPTAAAALFFHVKAKCIVWRAVIPAAIAGSITSAAFAWIASGLDVSLLRKLFGVFLLIIGVMELRKRKGQK